MRAALVQLCASDDPIENLDRARARLKEAASLGAEFVLTPEVTNCVSASRSRQQEVLCAESDDPTLAALRQDAQSLGLWLLIGSLALKTSDPDGRFANRSFLVDPKGQIAARYDKIHMFDVAVSETETYRESAGYRPGDSAALAPTPWGPIGLTICYDLRFPQLFRALAQAGARVITVPSAFSPVTGAAHWESLLRARAIETGAFILAPAQTGTHRASRGRERRTYGHSLAVAPWGELLADAGTDPGVTLVNLDLSQVEDARRRIPALTHDRSFTGP
jgi:predicted amidohydrolase